MIHEHVRQLGLAEGHDAALVSSLLLGLVIQHFTKASHQIHQRSIDERLEKIVEQCVSFMNDELFEQKLMSSTSYRLFLVTSVTDGTSPLAPLAPSQINNPNDGRLATALLTPSTGHAAIIVSFIL